MPVRNEAAFIERSLDAVLTQDYPYGRMEVLIADGMSTDATREIIERLKRHHPYVAVTVLDNPGRVVSTGINTALAQAKGEVIVRVDGHTVIAEDYVRECVAALRRSGADSVGGRMDVVGEGLFGQAEAVATSSAFGVGGARFHYSDREEWVDTVYLGAWLRDVFHRIGLFDEEMVRNQDDEHNYRLRSQGGKILLSPRIKSIYYNRTTLLSLCRQYFQYGYWKVRVMQKHPRQMRPRQFVPAVFAVALLVSLLMLPFSTVGKFMFAFVTFFYLFVNFAASALAVRKERWQLLLLLSLAFMTLHLAYGFGFLTRIVRFWNRWGSYETGANQPETQAQDVRLL